VVILSVTGGLACCHCNIIRSSFADRKLDHCGTSSVVGVWSAGVRRIAGQVHCKYYGLRAWCDIRQLCCSD